MIHKKCIKKFYNFNSRFCKERDDVAALTFDFMRNLHMCIHMAMSINVRHGNIIRKYKTFCIYGNYGFTVLVQGRKMSLSLKALLISKPLRFVQC